VHRRAGRKREENRMAEEEENSIKKTKREIRSNMGFKKKNLAKRIMRAAGPKVSREKTKSI